MGKEQKHNPILANRFKFIREKNKLTQAKLAEKLNCEPQTINLYENRRLPISKRVARLMANEFNIDEQYLLDENVLYPTKKDEMLAVIDQADRETILLNTVILSLLQLNNFEVEISDIGAGLQVDTVLERINNYLRISKDGKELCSLSVNDANKIGNALNDTFLMIIHRFFIDD